MRLTRKKQFISQDRLKSFIIKDIQQLYFVIIVRILSYYYTGGIYLIKEKNGNSKNMYEIYLKLTIKTSKPPR